MDFHRLPGTSDTHKDYHRRYMVLGNEVDHKQARLVLCSLDPLCRSVASGWERLSLLSVSRAYTGRRT